MPTQKTPSFLARLKPSQALALGFATVIAVGTILLMLPAASRSGESAGFLTALFTATSATCVTGLVVVDTWNQWTTFGQIVILALIQVGGLGFMTMTTLFAFIIGKRISLRERILIRESLNQFSLAGVVRLVRMVLVTTLAVEGFGAVLLSIRFIPEFGFGKGLYFGVFHAVSAFCNAGFDLMGDFKSFIDYVSDPFVTFVVAFLIIIGGIGFAVIADYHAHRDFRKLALHSKIVIVTTGALIIVGTAVIYLLERNNPETLGSLSPIGKFLASFFQAVTPRTAGFSTLPIGSMRDASLFFTILLMFIGASPGSTGGGIKTATFSVIVLTVWSIITGKQETEAFGRRIPRDVVARSLAILCTALALVVFDTLVLSVTEPQASLIQVLYEVVSAFGTVGLSTGITPSLSTIGRLVIILTMFAGRVGPFTLALALGERPQQAVLRYPEEKVVVG